LALQYKLPKSYTPFFFNFSSHTLIKYESIFQLGIKHIPPPPQTSDDEIKQAVETYVDKICWDHFFTKKSKIIGDTDNFEPPVSYEQIRTKPKPYKPKKGYEEVNSFRNVTARITQNYLAENPARKSNDPLHRLKQYMRDNPDLKLVLSDKNLGMIAMNFTQYNDLVRAHLEDRNTYTMIAKLDKALLFYQFFTKAKQEYQALYVKYFAQDTVEFKYLSTKFRSNFELPKFHVLPKLHKGTANLKSRPIVGAVNWITSPISRVLSKRLRPHLEHHWIIQNTGNVTKHFVNVTELWSQFPETKGDPILVTMDVKSLYTMIDTNLLAEVLGDIDPISKAMFEYINKYNYFQYDSKIMKQSQGIAMGTNCAPELANIFLLHKLDNVIRREMMCYSRFIDDIFFIWTKSEEELLLFFERVENLVPGINFDVKYSRKSIDYLDITILISGNSIQHYTHQKVLNKYAYITPKSCHPTHTFRGFITAELTRYKFNSSNYYYYQITKNLFYNRLVARGYPRALLKSIFNAHKYRFKLGIPPKIIKPRLHPLVIRYSFRPNLAHFGKKITSLSFLIQSKYVNSHNRRFLIAWSKSRNLFDQLCTSAVTPAQSESVKSVNDRVFRPLVAVGPNRFRIIQQ
jgi:hypothetical protein